MEISRKKITGAEISEKEKTFSFGGEISSAVYQGQKESFIKKFFK